MKFSRVEHIKCTLSANVKVYSRNKCVKCGSFDFRYIYNVMGGKKAEILVCVDCWTWHHAVKVKDHTLSIIRDSFGSMADTLVFKRKGRNRK